MSQSTFFTIIVPVIRSRYLAVALKSVLEQGFTNLELIVIDDCSKEAIAEAIDEFLVDERVTYIRNSVNKGGVSPAQVWNQGLALAKGQFTLILGDDDYYGPGLLQRLYDLSQQYPDSALLRARLCVVDSGGGVLNYGCRLPEWEPWWDTLYARAYYRHPLSICEHAFQTTELRETGGFWELQKAWGSDDAAVLKLALKGGCASTNDAWAYWRNDGANISSKPLLPQQALATQELCLWQEKVILEQPEPTNFSQQELLRAVRKRRSDAHDCHVALIKQGTWKYQVKCGIKKLLKSLFSWL